MKSVKSVWSGDSECGLQISGCVPESFTGACEIKTIVITKPKCHSPSSCVVTGIDAVKATVVTPLGLPVGQSSGHTCSHGYFIATHLQLKKGQLHWQGPFVTQ